MKVKYLVGKKIVDANIKRLKGHGDENFLELKFSDGTKAIIIILKK